VSNVLIGIIGVILFIGLALAGALFLGARFQQSRNTSVAAASVQAVSQITNGINLSNVDTTYVDAGYDPTLLKTNGYLKAIPVNPTGGPAIAILGYDATTTSGRGVLVVMQLAGATSDVCQAITRQTTNGSDIVGQDGIVSAANATQIPGGPVGCFKATASFGALTSGSHYAFARP
jgi:hypothetical protein